MVKVEFAVTLDECVRQLNKKVIGDISTAAEPSRHSLLNAHRTFPVVVKVGWAREISPPSLPQIRTCDFCRILCCRQHKMRYVAKSVMWCSSRNCRHLR